MNALFDQCDVEELIFDKLTEKTSLNFAEYMFETWPEIIEEISSEVVNHGEKLLDYAVKRSLKRASQLKRLELQKQKELEMGVDNG